MGEDGKRAFNALLTLLRDSELPKKKIRKSKNEPKPSKELEVQTIEGVESNDEVDEEDDYGNDIIQVEDDNEGDRKDPFEQHFAAPIAFNPPKEWTSHIIKSLDKLGSRSILQMPKNSDSRLSPEVYEDSISPLTAKQALAKMKHRLLAPFERTNGPMTDLQKQTAAVMFKYLDVLISNRTWENCDEYLNLVVLHLTNHIFKTRDRVLKNNSRLKEQAANKESEEDISDSVRDQGFTRPKVLVLLPTRDAAYKFVNRLTRVSGLAQSENKNRFKEAFYSTSDAIENKPEDFKQVFAGNSNEVFCLGVKFTRQALKLYSSFYGSDLIIASPLGLRLIVDKKDYDFLSSFEICVADQLDTVAMQSWTNIKSIFTKLNLTSKDAHDCDFSRVREWYLDEKAKYLRQTILLADFVTPEMVSLFNKSCLNVAGRFRSRDSCEGIINSSKIHIKQVFTRVASHDFSQDQQQRMDYFTNSLLPSLMRGAQTDGILVVAPNYVDFVLLRNYLEKNDQSYVSLSEYTKLSQLGRGRTFFADGRAKMMLYSARLHHYRRYGIKGTKTVVFFGLPDNPLFYQEIVRSLARTVIEQQIDPDLLKVHALYSKWDALKLERVVGTSKMAYLMEGLSDSYEFY